MATGEADEAVSTGEQHAGMDALQASITAIHAEIKVGQTDMKKELNTLCETIKRDMKEEIVSFKDEVNQKLNEIGVDLKNTKARTEEVEKRVAEVEEWNGTLRTCFSKLCKN